MACVQLTKRENRQDSTPPSVAIVGNLITLFCECGAQKRYYVFDHANDNELKSSFHEFLAKHKNKQVLIEMGLDLDEFPCYDPEEYEGDEEKASFKFTLTGPIKDASCSNCGESWIDVPELSNHINSHLFSSPEAVAEFDDPEEENTLPVQVMVTILD